jgi:AcrR family transcriptional regulator
VRDAYNTRKTQEERSNATREAVLDATIGCLIEQGYAATSTSAIHARAGVSRGALTHQFPTKAQLMMAAIRHLTAVRGRAFVERAKQIPPDADRLEAGIRLLWSETFENAELFTASMELRHAARTEKSLHAPLLELERRMAKLLRRECATIFGPEISSKATFDEAFRAALFHLRGAAVTNLVRPEGASTRGYLTETIRLFRCMLERTDPPSVGDRREGRHGLS